MAKTVLIVATLTLMLMALIPQSNTRALPDRDLIDGAEFLSLFINRGNREPQPKNYKEIESNDNVNGDDLLDSVFSKNEDMQAENSKYDLAGLNQLNKEPKDDLEDEIVTTTNAIVLNAGNESVENKETDSRKNTQIVQRVTSGSKVIFLEKLTSYDDVKKDQKSNDLSNEMRSLEDVGRKVNSTEDQETSGSDFEVEEVAPSAPFDIQDHFDDEEVSRDDFINRSHKTELSVDDSEPVTNSVPGAANIHQSQPQMSSSRSQTDTNPESLVPFQTVIYHDYHKSMQAQPRSVSYTSIAQSVDQINPWTNSEAFLEAKKNVSQGLQQTKFPEPMKTHSQKEKVYSEPEKVYSEPAKVYSEPAHVYSQPSKFYSEPAKVYSEPAKMYGKPEIQYGEPSKFYSEPAKVYSEPAKVYSEPAKIYSEPAKTYWPTPLTSSMPTTTESSTTKQPNFRKVIFNLDKLPYDFLNAPQSNTKLLDSGLGSERNRSPATVKTNLTQKSPPAEDDGSYRPHEYTPHRAVVTERPSYKPSHYTESSEDLYTPTPEQNYEVEESVSVKTNGRAHGIQPPSQSTASPKDDGKVGYVFEGRNFRKYRVEEKTPDGFIVGEYGVVSHNDGSLRGVRYTADSNINPSLIHDALMKFLSL